MEEALVLSRPEVLSMSDCVYVAWAEATRHLGVEPKEGSRPLFDLARSLFGEPEGLWAGAAPLVVGLLCQMHGLTLAVHCHPWFDRAYYRAAARSQWQRWAVDLWGCRAFWRELEASHKEVSDVSRGTIYFWLGGHHAYYALEPDPSHFVIMRTKIYRRQEVE